MASFVFATLRMRPQAVLLHLARHPTANVACGSRHVSGSPIVELREYRLKSERTADYVARAEEHANLIREVFPLRLFCMPETGGLLNVATHFYAYSNGHAERDAAVAVRKSDPRLGMYSEKHSRPAIEEARSLLFVEAPLVAKFELHGMQNELCPSGEASAQSIYELRRYQLKLGYDTVPRFLEYYGKGLPSKLGAAGTDPSTSLVTLIYSDVGSLNEVIELWRHGGGTAAMDRSRQAARSATEWRQAIADIAGLAMTFTTTIHKPLPFSPWR